MSLIDGLALVTGFGFIGSLGGGLWWLVLERKKPGPTRKLEVWSLVGTLLTAGATIIVLLWLDVGWYLGVLALICYVAVGAFLRLSPPEEPK